MAWYEKYYSKTIFKSVEGGAEPTKKFEKYFTKGNMFYITQVHRFVKEVAKEVPNTSFEKFCLENNLPIFDSYRMVFSNKAASYSSISKYDKEQPVVNEAAWLLSLEWTKQHFHPIMCGSVVTGQEDVLNNMDMQTSCGYPASLHYQNKKDFLDSSSASILTDYWDIIGTNNELNIVPIWTCSQKIEMRTVEKLRNNKVRTFTASPIEHSVATNRICLDMNNKFYNGNNRCWSFVGGSKYLSGWDRLYHRLNVHPHAYELDESEYDSSLFARALADMIELRWDFLAREYQTNENYKRLVAVYESIIHSVVVLEEGELIQKSTGNPSGSSNTIVDNTIILYRLFSYAYILLAMEQNIKPTYMAFSNNVEAALNGDDNTYTCSEAINLWFIPTNISRVWTSIGVTTTTPCQTSRELKDVRFLSQGFVYHEQTQMWFPNPDPQRVLSSLMFASDVDDPRWHLLRASALRLDSYGNPLCRSILTAYIEYLHKHYWKKWVGEIKGIPMKDILALNKSNFYIEALYTGNE